MTRVHNSVGLLLLSSALALGVAGCSDDDGSPNDCAAQLLPGDLVITEIMPNPSGADDGKEWFEIYNATTTSIDLTRLRLVYSKADGSDRKTHLVASGLIGPGEYQVFGGVLEVAKPAWVDYAYANELGTMTNSGGRLALECGNTTVDQVVYLESAEGVSLCYDGDLVPDAMANDTLASWCESQSVFEVDLVGTPGAANDPCGPVVPPGTCLEGGASRNTVAPAADTVIITELMADPAASGDTAGEWIELHFTQAADLNGLQLGEVVGTVMHTVTDATCLPVLAGDYVLVAKSFVTADNGGLPQVDIVWPNLGLGNTGGTIFVGHADAVLDQVTYTDAMVSAGVSASLDATALDPTANDDPAVWCDGTAVYGVGDRGTPGAANPSCGSLPSNTCLDGGTPRAVVQPLAGDVVISEIMPSVPTTVGDANGEWFEVYFAEAADLNGLQLGDAANPTSVTVESADCLSVAAGSYIVFARKSDSAVNGGLTNVTYTFGFTLNNSTETLYVGLGGTVLDSVAYPSSTQGVALSLSPEMMDSVSNDDPAHWCDATASYGAGGMGTPGAANPSCGFVPPNSCLDGGTPRTIVAPQLGDVVITEYMADPATPVDDSVGEWIEVYFAQAADLNGLQLGDGSNPTSITVQSSSCIAVTGGTYVVFARNAISATNGGLDNVTYVFGFTLNQSNETIYVGYGGTTLDSVTYTSSTAGAAASLTAGVLDPGQNDTSTNWCLAGTTDVYGAGGRGTPGDPNPSCP